MNYYSIIVSVQISLLAWRSPPPLFSGLDFAHYARPVKGNCTTRGTFQRTFVISTSSGGRRADIMHSGVLIHC